MTIYKHRQPSTTSLSDDDDNDDGHQSAYLAEHPLVFSPGQWSSKRLPSVPSRSPMAALPPEILIHIFKHLHLLRDIYAALRVSRTWCECSIELLWHKPTLDKHQTLANIAQLLISPTPTFTYATFIRRLNFLALSDSLTDKIFATFADCDRLERLTLVNCNKLTTSTLDRVLPSFANLVAMDASGVKAVTNDAVVGLALAARRLQGINLTGCKDVSNKGIMALAENCPVLRRIKLSHLESLTDEPICALAKSCPLLLEIDLISCKLITDVAIRDIWTHSTHMREIRLSHCDLLTDSGFPVALRKDHPDTPSPFSSYNSDSLSPLVLSRTLEHLRMLDLTACHRVTDEALEGILSYAPKIRNLGLSKCTLLTDRSLESICKLGRHLHYLHLGHADKITDRAVRTLARSCTRLRYVDFANCTQLTDLAVFELATLPKLRRVGLVRVNNLTDEAIYALAERHATLERIHLSYCDQISVMAVHFLLQKLHKLTHLSLTGVPAFRQSELQQFCRPPPSDFNSNQASAFCVFSGKGVSQLRAFLTELFDHITEMNGTDDTEYEDDDFEDPEVYDEDDTPEPEEVEEVEEESEDNLIAQQVLLQSLPRSHLQNSGYPRQPPTHSASYPPPSNSSGSATLNNLHGVTDRLNAQLMGTLGPSRHSGRTMADILPIVENMTSSPPRSDIAFRSSTIIGSRHDDLGMSYSGGVSSYGDIGRGRGVQNALVDTQLQLRRGHELHLHHRPSPNASQMADDTARMVAVLNSLRTMDNRSTPSSSRRDSPNTEGGVVWPYQEPVSPTMSTHAPSQETTPTTNDGRGRHVKRSLRNTLNVASTLLSFGRSPTREGASGSGSASGSGVRG